MGIHSRRPMRGSRMRKKSERKRTSQRRGGSDRRSEIGGGKNVRRKPRQWLSRERERQRSERRTRRL
jgi:hypothetical protein